VGSARKDGGIKGNVDNGSAARRGRKSYKGGLNAQHFLGTGKEASRNARRKTLVKIFINRTKP